MEKLKMTNKLTKLIELNGNDYVYINAIDLDSEETVMERLDRLIEEAILLIKENELINLELKEQKQAWLKK